MSKASIAWTLGIIVSLGGVLAVWESYGWITRTAYGQDHEISIVEQQTAILKALDNQSKALELIDKEIKKNNDQWECDETDEELEDIEFHLLDDASILEVVTLQRQKDKLAEVWKEKGCSRFTD